MTYEEFIKMKEQLDDAEDLLLLEQAKQEDAGKPGVSLEEMMTKFGITPEGAKAAE